MKRARATTDRDGGPRWRHGARWPLLLFALVTVAVIAAGSAVFLRQQAEVGARQQRLLMEIAQSKAREVAAWREERISDARLFTDNSTYIALMTHADREAGSAAWRSMVEHMSSLLGNPRYESVFLLGEDGRMRLSVGEAPGNAGILPILAREVVTTGKVRFSDFISGADTERVRFTLLVPVMAQDGARRVGAVLGLQIDPYVYFYPIIARWPVPSESAELLLTRRMGNTILLLSDPLHAREGLAIPATADLVAARVGRAPGFVRGVDYRGVEVIAVTQPVAGTPWALVAKVDQREVFAPLRELALWITGLALLFILMLGGFAWRERKRLRSQRNEAELGRELVTRHFDYLARYANDIILLADPEGRLMEVNDRAVEVYGYSREELLRMGVADLRAPEQAQGLRDQWRALDQQDAVVYETLHRSRDGRVFPVESSARRIEVGGRVFFQAIVRDISERKAAQQRILRLSWLYAALSQTNEAIVRLTDRDALFQAVCRIAVEQGRFLAAWIGALDEQGRLRLVSDAGAFSDFFESQRERMDPHLLEGDGPTATALREGRVVVTNDYVNDPTTAYWHALAERLGVHALATMPLREEGRVVGVFGVVAGEPGFFDDELVNLLREMALDLSYALDNLARERRRLRADEATRAGEQRYRQLVESMSSGVAVYESPDGEHFYFKEVNHALEVIEKRPRETLIGRELMTVFPGAVELGVLDALRRVWHSGRPEHVDAGIYRDERMVGWRENFIYKLPTGELVAVYDDVTERKRAEQRLRESRERLALVLKGTNDGFWDFDFERGEAWYSRRFAELFGFEPKELDKTLDGWRRLVHPDDQARVQAELDAHLVGRTPQYQSEHRMLTKSGEQRWMLARGRVVRRDPTGRPLRMAGTHTDITARKRVEEEVKLWARVFEASREAIFITDAERHVVTVNRAYAEMTGYTPEEVIGRTPPVLGDTQQDRSLHQNMWAAINETGHWQGEIRDRRKNGESYPLWLAVTAATDAWGSVQNYIAIGTDVSERKAAEERIRFLAHHDVLTGLPNRALLADRLGQVIVHAQRTGSRAAVLFADLDRFKDVNDSLGHHFGDKLLTAVGERLVASVRVDDTVCRQGGDEFVIVLSEVEQSADAAHVAAKIIATVSRPFQLNGSEVHITPSIGIALYPEDGSDGDTLVRNADAAMYLAKEKGRHNFQFFVEELNTRARARLRLENRLRHALDRGEFVLHYQPQVNSHSGALAGVEALIRWRHGGERLMKPSEFIPLAEETGLILPIGQWVLEEACRQQRAWVEQGLPALPMAVNISAIQFHQRELLATLRRLVSRGCVGPGALEVELTEGIIMEDAESSIATLRDIKALGIGLAVDDFGTGYSSLSYLRRFPIDRLKVDQSFVRDLTTDPIDRAITESIIGLAKSLGLRVIAEGVESADEAQILRERDCDELQGYYFAPPLGADELVQWWRARPNGAGPT